MRRTMIFQIPLLPQKEQLIDEKNHLLILEMAVGKLKKKS